MNHGRGRFFWATPVVSSLSLTHDWHVVFHLHNDPSREELTGEEEEVGVVKHDQELQKLLLGLEAPTAR